MKIFICEDNEQILNKITNIIKNYIIINAWDLEIEEKTDNPETILSKVENNPASCYFLDIDLGDNKMSGIELGVKIRNIDPLAKLIYITSYDEMRITVLDKMISPLAYIVKGEETMTEKIRTSLKVSYNLYLSSLKKDSFKEKIPINVGNRQLLFKIDDILYFETIGNHKISLKLKNNCEQQFFGKITGLSELDKNLFNCHRSYVVNLKNIINVKSDIIEFNEGTVISIGFRSCRKVKKELKNFNTIFKTK